MNVIGSAETKAFSDRNVRPSQEFTLLYVFASFRFNSVRLRSFTDSNATNVLND